MDPSDPASHPPYAAIAARPPLLTPPASLTHLSPLPLQRTPPHADAENNALDGLLTRRARTLCRHYCSFYCSPPTLAAVHKSLQLTTTDAFAAPPVSAKEPSVPLLRLRCCPHTLHDSYGACRPTADLSALLNIIPTEISCLFSQTCNWKNRHGFLAALHPAADSLKAQLYNASQPAPNGPNIAGPPHPVKQRNNQNFSCHPRLN